MVTKVNLSSQMSNKLMVKYIRVFKIYLKTIIQQEVINTEFVIYQQKEETSIQVNYISQKYSVVQQVTTAVKLHGKFIAPRNKVTLSLHLSKETTAQTLPSRKFIRPRSQFLSQRTSKNHGIQCRSGKWPKQYLDRHGHFKLRSSVFIMLLDTTNISDAC